MDRSLLCDEFGKERLKSYCSFDDDGLYIVSAIARPKENEHLNEKSTPVFRKIAFDERSLDRAYRKMYALAQYELDSGSNANFRLYVSINKRDLMKAFFDYQQHISDIMHKYSQGHEPSKRKLYRLDSEWKSILCHNENRDGRRLLIDVDEKNDSKVERIIDDISQETTVYGLYPTPNGSHIITDSFAFPRNELIQNSDNVEVKSDGELFIEQMF